MKILQTITYSAIFGLALGLAATSATASPRKDPLAGDTWHAVHPSWPGTLIFDGSAKKVTLSPLGAEPMVATYSYTLKPATKPNAPLEGTLVMKNEAGQTSESHFAIKDGKELTLQFSGVHSRETYQRLTTEEQVKEQERLMKMLAERGKAPVKK